MLFLSFGYCWMRPGRSHLTEQNFVIKINKLSRKKRNEKESSDSQRVGACAATTSNPPPSQLHFRVRTEREREEKEDVDTQRHWLKKGNLKMF